MKRAFVFLIVLLISSAFAPINAANLSDLAYDASGATVTITDCDTESSGELVIPEVIEGKSVTGIGSSAFRDCRDLTSITIPGSVTSIGLAGFYNCSSLTSVTIGDGINSIGGAAFAFCARLTSIMIPDGVTNIRNGVFSGCTDLTGITIGDGVTSIGSSAFRDCSNLTSIILPDSVTSIGENIFYGCTRLEAVTLPDGVEFISGSAFFGCAGLTSITLPDSVTGIGDSAFLGCDSLAVIAIPDSLTSIGDSAFLECASLTSIMLPDGVEFISGSAFFGCAGLTSITLPDSVTSIGEFAFHGCTGLTDVTIGDSVTSIGGAAFAFCSDLTRVTFLGVAPSVSNTAFSVIPQGAKAHVFPSNFASFGGAGTTWNGLIVDIDGSHVITVSAQNGVITFSGPDHYGGGYYPEGSEATLTATPDASYAFAGWRGEASGAVNPLTLTVDGDKSVEAILVNQSIYDDIVFQGQATVTANPESHGLVRQADYDAVAAERDARPTVDEVADARLDSIVVAKDWQTGEVSLCFGLQKTDDFINWVAYGEGTLSDLGNGQFKVNLPLGPGKEWLRMAMKK